MSFVDMSHKKIGFTITLNVADYNILFNTTLKKNHIQILMSYQLVIFSSLIYIIKFESSI